MSTRLYFVIVVLTLLVFGSVGAAEDPKPSLSSEDAAFFEKKIRPILVEHCYACHSQRAIKAKKLRGGLLLDSRAGVLKGGDSGQSFVPGKPAESLMIESLKYESFEMPPKGQLPAHVIADFEEWIKRSAPDPRRGNSAARAGLDIEAGRNHWAYRPLKMPPIPRPAGAQVDSVIDAFLQVRLQDAGLQQSGLADRHVLVRRLYFDLIGLPPTPEQIDAFVHDDSPDAYVRLVDRLMASARFGERWGRHWLDVVRFSESITLRGFIFPEAWRYRDYVIDTFNSDRRFDRFVQEQIAGDLLPAKSLETHRANLIATAFLTLGNNNLEDQDKGKLRMDVIDEQLETIGRGLLAQTIGCARCHDHKFDPIPTKDYYALAGILRNTKTLNHSNVSKWIELPLPLEPDREAEFKQHQKWVAELKATIKRLKGNVKGTVTELQPLPLQSLAGVALDDKQAVLTGTWMFSQHTKSYVGSGYQHDMGAKKGSKTAIFRPRLERDGEYEVRFAYTPGSNRSPAVPIKVVRADESKTVTIDQRKQPPIGGRFVSLGRFHFKADQQNEVVVSNGGTTGVVIIDAVQFLPVELASKPPAVVSAKPLSNQNELNKLQKQLKTLTKSAPTRPKYMSVQEEAKIEDTRIHIRGNVHNLGPAAPRGFLQVTYRGTKPAFKTTQSGRKELADWIVDVENPLTARVIANRLWYWLYGQGLVRTTDNFGTTGELPSHPVLLDYLAARLLEKEWSVKSLLREMVLARAYRLSSHSNESGLAKDPENRLLWRMNRRRLDAECLLDAMLAINGQLKSEIGGSTIRSGTPNDYNYKHQSQRRAVYWPVFRNSLPAIFDVFDFANPSMVTGRRDSSSTAPQALFLMNNPWVMQQADHAAAQLLSRPGLDDRQRLQQLVLATLGREPTLREQRSITVYLASEVDQKKRSEKWAQVFQTFFASMDFRYLH